ncbi:MAG TPA: ATP-binding protein, partial [Candidatus Caenarcaniphilales bacterium]
PIIYANPAFERITGYARSDFIGRNCRFLQGIDTDREEVARIRASIETNTGCQVTLLNYRKDGTPFWNELTLTPAGNVAGGTVNFVGVARDVTERKHVEEELKALTRQLAKSNQELSDFARVASHDLQEPLRKIQAFSDRLRTKNLVASEGQPYLERMQSAAARMSSLITDLLALSRVTTKVQPFVPIDLTKLAQEVVSDLEIRIEEVKAKVELGALPVIEADPLQMRQLFQNLIGNALKFQRPGVPPVVSVWGSCTSDKCIFTIADNGIGFDKKYKERIFNVFERLHGRSDYEGTGVGLAICRKIVERHGGTVSADSTPGAGATFTISLPNRQGSEV